MIRSKWMIDSWSNDWSNDWLLSFDLFVFSSLSFRSCVLHLKHLINIILIFSLKHAPTQEQNITKTRVVTSNAISPEVHPELMQRRKYFMNRPHRRPCTSAMYNIRNIDSTYKSRIVVMALSLITTFNKLSSTCGFVSKEQKMKNLCNIRFY